MRRIFNLKNAIIFVVVILVLTIISLSISENSKLSWLRNILSVPLKPFQIVVSAAGSSIKSGADYFKDIKETKKNIEILNQKVVELERENDRLLRLEKENRELKRILGIKDKFFNYDFIGCNIIAKDPGNWFNTFTIDKGKKENISVNDAVINGYGLVGRVIQSNLNTAKVVTIIDLDSTVSARMTSTGDVVSLKGDLKLSKHGQCKLE